MKLLELGGGVPEGISGPEITQAATEGDPAALRCFQTVGGWLGQGLADLAAVLDPACFVIGGGVSEAGDLLLDPARAAFERALTGRGHRPFAEIRKAQLGQDAGIVGAADLARASQQDRALLRRPRRRPRRQDRRDPWGRSRSCAARVWRTRPRTRRPRRTPRVPIPTSLPRWPPPGSPARRTAPPRRPWPADPASAAAAGPAGCSAPRRPRPPRRPAARRAPGPRITRGVCITSGSSVSGKPLSNVLPVPSAPNPEGPPYAPPVPRVPSASRVPASSVSPGSRCWADPFPSRLIAAG